MRNLKQLTVCFMFLLFAACNQEQNLEPAFLDTLEKAKLEDEESLSRTLNSVSNIQVNGRSASVDYGTLDLEKIYKRIASEEQEFANYMIRLYPPEGVENSLEYLVMIGTDYGFRAYILQYQTTPEHINSINDPTIYTGYINILDMERKLLAQNYFIEGKDSEVPENSNSRSMATSCACEYEYDLIVHNDLSATLIVTGIVCTCQEADRLGDPGSDNGAGGIGDPIYDPSNPDAEGGGGSGSGDGEPGGITRDPVGTVKTLPCDPGQVYTSNGSCVEEMEYWKNQIDQESDLDEKRKLQLHYISTHNGQAGRDFKEDIESLLSTSGITVGEVSDINEIVNNYWEELVGRLIIANFYPVVEAAKPFVELALIETGSGVLFQAVKGLLSVKWSVQLAKIGINTTSIANVVNRMKSGLSFGLNNSSLTLKIGGRNLFGTANSTKKVYNFKNVTSTEAKTIFQDMTAGRQVKRVDMAGGKYRETVFWRDAAGNRNSITFRNYSSSGQLGQPTIDVNMLEISNIKLELKFFL